MRVFELAKELGLPSKDLIARIHAMGVVLKSHMSVLDEATVLRVKTDIAAAKPTAAESPQTPPTQPPPLAPLPPASAKTKATVGTPASAKASAVAQGAMADTPVGTPAPAKAETPPAPLPAAPRKKAEIKPAPTPSPAISMPVMGPDGKKTLTVRGAIIVRELAEQLSMKPNQLIAELMSMNIFASINERLELKVAQQVVEKHGFVFEHEKKTAEQKPPPKRSDEEPDTDPPENMEPRPPVVTFMGHIDHGKTSLMDRIRNSAVARQEAGGITQHIGAYTVEHAGRKITFLDTPGHAAFTAMRARGANLTDIAVIVIAADDGIMPQTEEAIQHARAADTTIMVAINKMDLPAANIDRVKKQLQAMGLTPEDWGGTTVCCPVSAKTGEGLDHFLELIELQAEMLELRANPRRRAEGYVIEARLEAGMGPTAALLVTRGTLQVGDALVCGAFWGRVKALIDDSGIKVRAVTPGRAVKCMGLAGVPQAGEMFKVCANDRQARELGEKRADELRAQQVVVPRKASLEDLFSRMATAKRLELRLIIKCDMQGSLEALLKAMEDLKSDKVAVSILLSGIGNITENDVLLASASDAIVIGFNVSKEPDIAQLQKREGVEVRLYSIIYEIVDQIREAMQGLLKPEIREKFIGKAEVLQVFTVSKKHKAAGCSVVNGRIFVNCRTRVKRKGDTVHEGTVVTLKHFQDDVKEMKEGQECGVRMDNFSDFQVGDTLEFYEVEKIAQKL
ncbi:MAG: translation initiation factor IF-2 [Lentisphaerae bacterium]|nr:translation initiation factor IF-2 [Lentisphaerota bacterium]